MTPPVRSTPRRRWRAPVAGVICGVLLVFVTRFVINETTVADRLVSPLLLTDTTGVADAIVVSGAGVTGPCVPNSNGVQRVLHAARAWRQGRAPIVVFTGGMGDGTCPIAEAMARLARDIGVPDSAIVTETASRTTYENARLATPLLRRLGVRRVLVVTDRLHVRRAAGAFTTAGFTVERLAVPVYDGHADNTGMLAAGLREYAAVQYYRMRGWIESDQTAAAPPAADTAPSPETVPPETAPPEIASSGSVMPVSHPSGPVVVLGASYAGGWKIERLGPHAVVNKGVSGQQSFEMLERFDRDVVAASPRAVILWGFINDVFRAKNVDEAMTQARASFTEMVTRARTAGIEPIIATEVTIRPEASWTNGLAALVGAIRGKESYQARINRHVTGTNRWLVDLARREQLLLLDFQSTLADGGDLRRKEFAAADGSHISAAGYSAITKYATPLLERQLGPRQ